MKLLFDLAAQNDPRLEDTRVTSSVQTAWFKTKLISLAHCSQPAPQCSHGSSVTFVLILVFTTYSAVLFKIVEISKFHLANEYFSTAS